MKQMQPLDPYMDTKILYDGEPWEIWSVGSHESKVWIVRPDPAGDETGGSPMEQREVLLADCERPPALPTDYDEPMF